MESVPPKSLDKAFAHLEAGHMLLVPTCTRCYRMTKQTLAKFRKVGAWMLKEEGDGYRMQTGRTSVYLLPGQLKYGN
jgi:hypothetical protein